MMAIMYGYLIAVIIDVWLMWRKLKAKLIAKYGEQSVSKGSRSFSYACLLYTSHSSQPGPPFLSGNHRSSSALGSVNGK